MTTTSLEEIRKTAEMLRSEYHIKSEPRHLGWQDFLDVIRANRRVFSIGLIAGLALAGIPAAARPWSESNAAVAFLLGLLEHVGIGLIVSAFAIVAYEWVSEARRSQIHSYELVNLLTLGASDRLESTHKMLLGANADRFEALRAFTRSVATVAKGDDWLSKPLVAFLSELASKMSLNAKSIERVAEEMRLHSSASARYDLVFPDPGKLTDFALKELLLALPSGSRYCAASNALIWRDLTDFRDAHAAAVKAGVTIQRIFILFQKADEVAADAQAIATIYRHHDLSKELGESEQGGRYETRFVNADQYERDAPKLAESKHFGVFRPVHGPALAFDVAEDDLSQFQVFAAGPGNSLIHDFDEFWKHLPKMDDVTLRYTLRAWRMRRIDSGSYSALSSFDNWTSERLKELHEDSMEAADHRHVQVRRIFVVDGHQSTSEMERVLDVQAKESRHHRGYYWLTCMKEDLPPTLTSPIPIPYGIFKDRGKSGSTKQVLFEVYSGLPGEPFEISGPVAEKMSNAFDRYWSELWHRRQDILTSRFGPQKASEWALPDTPLFWESRE